MKSSTLLLFCLCTQSLQAVSPPSLADVDGDGKDDLGVYHWETGTWYVYGSGTGHTSFTWGSRTRRPVLGDFDGDGRLDPAVFDAQTTEWIIYQTDTGTVRRESFGRPGMVPVPGDYDGDGKTDLALFERDSAQWIVRRSGGGGDQTFVFGWPEARPVPADYDGDGKTDPAVYHRHSGVWYVFRSTEGFHSLQFGYPGARAVPGDYDGDGRDDIAVYATDTGTWFYFGSTDGFRQVNWGFASARPVPADYDGDGTTDFAVWERATARWYIWESGSRRSRILTYGWPMATPLQSYQHGGIEGGVVLCFGDSITFGVGGSNPPATGYPARLERELAPALGGMFDVINAGVPGETTTQGLNRFGGVLDQNRPEFVLLMEGTNDHFFNRPYAGILDHYSRMIDTARSRNADVLLATTPPVISTAFTNRAAQSARIRGFNPFLINLANQKEVPVVPVYESITSRPFWFRDLMDAGSGNHPNNAGYEVLSNTFLESVRQAIEDGRLY